MRRAIDAEFDAILADIAQAHGELKAQMELLEKSVDETFRQLHKRINGEEVRPGKKSS